MKNVVIIAASRLITAAQGTQGTGNLLSQAMHSEITAG